MDTASQSSMSSLEGDFSTRLLLFSHEFPSDDVQELFRSIHRHSKGQRFPLLAAFLSNCDIIIKEEVAKLPKHLQESLPSFQTVTELALNFYELRKGPLGGSWEGVFLCIYQIATLIGYFEAKGIDYDLHTGNTTVVGMSLGLFAAAATVAASSLADLAYNSAESVRVSFAFCAHVGRTSDLLESRGIDERDPSWAYVITGLSADDVQRQLDKYNEETSTSLLNKVTISHTDKGSVGVTGPPSRLQHLFRHSDVLKYSKHSSLQIHGGLCHVQNVYDGDDVSITLETAKLKSWQTRPLRIPLLSPHTGLPFPADHAAHLIELIVQEALLKPLHFDSLISSISGTLSSPGLLTCDVFHFRTSIISHGLLSTLESTLSRVKLHRQDVVEWLNQDYPSPPRLTRDSKLAVVGMSCRMPGGANDTELFWQLLVDGRDVHTTVPPDRFNLAAHFDPTGKLDNSTDTPFGNFIDNPGRFDPGFFNMSPREAEQTDPMQRLALVTAYEALEMAGIVPNRTPSSNSKRIGTFYGQASDDYREVNANQNVSTYGIPGTERAFGNGRINYFFKFGGPSFNLDTACSSGLAAVHAACTSLWAGDSDLVIAGGLNVITNPDIYCMLTKGHFLSKTGQCKVWDKEADGYCRSDGIGSVVIKRLEDAIADNDNILATIVAGATNHSCDAISITHPHVDNQKDNYHQVLYQAGVNPLDVSHVELHGTGTQAGDAVESQSVLETFAPLIPRRRPDQRLSLGALKSNIGHGEAAAGVASLIKVLLMYQKNQIPRHIGIHGEINPVVAKHLHNRNAGLVFETTPWHKPEGGKRLAIVNSFGAHGGNTTLLLEDAPGKLDSGASELGHFKTHIISISAKSKASLKGNIKDLFEYLDQEPLATNVLANLSYTTVARRIHHPRRIAAAISSVGELREFLKASIEASDDVRPSSASNTNIVFAFTGQGSFYVGVGQQLYRHFPGFRIQVQQLDRIVQRLGFPSIRPVIDDEANRIEASALSPVVSQLTILILQISLIRFWQLLGIKPDAVIGHSLGEYAALVAAGVLSAADSIYLVGERAKQLENISEPRTHGMLSVRADAATIKAVVEDRVPYELSCLNTSEDTVVSGSRGDIERIRTILEADGLKCLALDIPYAFHSAQLDPILDSYEKIASHVSFKAPQIPVISPLLGQCIFDGKTINAKYLRRASREPVNFAGALQASAAAGIIDDKTLWMELGPHPVCSSFARGQLPSIKVLPSLKKNEDNFTTIASTLAVLHVAGLNIHWNEYYRPFEKSFNLLLLKHYHWNDNDYFIPYTGTWTLEKAYHTKGKSPSSLAPAPAVSTLQTSAVQRVVVENVTESTASLVAITDIQRSDFLNAVKGHTINGRGVVTGSIWADMALTIGEHLYKLLHPCFDEIFVNVAEMAVTESQIPHNDQGANAKPQLIQVEAILNLAEAATHITWYALNPDGIRPAHTFASARVYYEDPRLWKSQWRKSTHFVTDRITALSSLAATGLANRLSRNMVYQLFQNVVNYADRYRGMQSVVLHGLEAFAEIELVADRHGTWHTPPHWIDSVFQLAGFVMNGSDVTNTRDFFYITPGWDALRLAKPLEADRPYQSYVRMFPSEEEPNLFLGDIYALQDGEIVGTCEGIKFRKIPRIIMTQLFSGVQRKSHQSPTASDKKGVISQPDGLTNSAKPIHALHKPAKNPSAETSQFSHVSLVTPELRPEILPDHTSNSGSHEAAVTPDEAVDAKQAPEVVTNVLAVVARETGISIKDFTPDASFNEMGIDSLMSLVLSEKLLREVGVEVKSATFLECPTVGEFTDWLTQYH